MLFYKRKDADAEWTHHYIIHGRCREMVLGILRDVS
ncbi:hypothetical protein predicted by Glimmer/Critica [Bartonella tribocorum CIP 105476]|uniref:Uncharacterized protein n=1 Tax=Bartonella tribocorum (strain DSM 28219 / CCUG 45778 / CIP 105476 / IBS 506) TaxID=382640 RepID=A9INU1_BART1|nr:hypothetical protein predicted by Glimmer/Critica [Bartonella tribocorum CIP 105476]